MQKPTNEREHAAGAKGGKVREAIGKMLSNEEIAAEARQGEEEALPDSATHAAAAAHVGEIEKHVGDLVGDPALTEEGKAREEECGSRVPRK